MSTVKDLWKNEVIGNQAFCFPISSEAEKCHPDLGDGRKNYDDQEKRFTVFKHGENFYVRVNDNLDMSNDRAGWLRELTMDEICDFQDVFGRNFKPIKSLPQVEVG